MGSRFFIPPEQIQNQKFTLLGTEARHAALVLRKKAGDLIDLFDGKDLSYQGRIESVSSERIDGAIVAQQEGSSVPRVELVLYQALIKGPKWDWLIEKACEVGVTRVVPLMTERTVVQLTLDMQKAKIDRWQRIAMAASKQCGRSDIMKVGNPMTLTDALLEQGSQSLSLIPWEKESKISVRAACLGRKADRVNVFIGPEGGWEAQEVETAVRQGVVSVRLGPTLLRSETAGLVAATLVLSEFGGYA